MQQNFYEFLITYFSTCQPAKTELRYDTTERMEMLVHHRQALNKQIAQLQEHKIKLDDKIELYKKEIDSVNTIG